MDEPKKDQIGSLDIDEIKRRLKSRHDIQEDELNVLFKGDEAQIRDFYRNMVLSAQKLEDSDGDDSTDAPPGNDTYKLAPEYEAELKRHEKDKKKAVKLKKKAAFNAGAADLSHLKPEEQVSFEEAQQAVKDALNPKPKSVRLKSKGK